MLTKAQINVRRRGDRLYPQFIDLSDEAVATDVNDVWSAFQEAPGKTLGEIERNYDHDGLMQKSYGPGLIKLCQDRCKFDEHDESVMELRWRAFAAAETLRGVSQSAHGMVQDIAKMLQVDALNIQEHLYDDLPCRRRVAKAPLDSEHSLVERYNCGQVQGLLYDAEEMQVKVEKCDTALKRRLMQAIRFHGLAVRILDHAPNKLSIEVEGPLKIFQQVQSYGIKLASFFPHVLLAEKWSIEARVKHKKQRMCTLKLNQKSNVSASYVRAIGHLPEEVSGLLERWQKHSADRGSMRIADEIFQIHHGEFIVPDFTLDAPGHGATHVELFHRWHKSGLSSRLNTLADRDDIPLILGVQSKLAKDMQLSDLLDNRPNLLRRVFIFRDFPTVKDLQGALFAWQR